MDIDELIINLYKHGCILIGDFKLSSGKWSPYYIDLRRVPSYPSLFNDVADIYVENIRSMDYNFYGIVGIATAGIPLATLIAYKLNKPLIYVRKESKTHGTKRDVEGIFDKNSRLLIIDDVITTGSSIYNAILKIRKYGGIVDRGVVLIDREQNGIKFLRENGIYVNAITKTSYLFKVLLENKCISCKEYKKIVKYISDIS